MTEPGKLLLLASLLEKDGIISKNGKAFLKELILRRHSSLTSVLQCLDSADGQDMSFLDTIHKSIEECAHDKYDLLFQSCSLERGKAVSKAEREEKSLHGNKSLIYGEVEFNSFARVLRKISPQPGTKFYDLGSGTGKAVFVARFLYDFDSCNGIEILEGLHNAGIEVVHRYNRYFKQLLLHTTDNDVVLKHGSILDLDWSDGDLIFANSTCFDENLMGRVSELAERLKPGSFVVTFTKGLESPAFEVMERKRYRMSWGPATVFIHRRRNPDGSPFSSDTLQEVPDDDSYRSEDSEDERPITIPSVVNMVVDPDDDTDDTDDALEDLD